MLIQLSADKTVSEAAVTLQTAVQASHYCVMQVRNLKETMTKTHVRKTSQTPARLGGAS